MNWPLVIDAEFGAGDEGPDELGDRGVIPGFDEGKGALFFFGVGWAGEDALEGLFDKFFGAVEIAEVFEERGFGDEFVEEVAVGEEHRLLDRGGEVLLEEIREDRGEVGAEGFVFRGFVTEGDAEGAGEGFGGEGFIESAGEEGILRRAAAGGGSGVELVSAGFAEGANEAAEVVSVVREVAGEPGEEFGMAGGVGGIHEVDGVDKSASEEKGPDAVDDGGGEFRVVGGDGLREFLTAGKLRDRESGKIPCQFFVFPELLEPLFRRGRFVIFG